MTKIISIIKDERDQKYFYPQRKVRFKNIVTKVIQLTDHKGSEWQSPFSRNQGWQNWNFRFRAVLRIFYFLFCCFFSYAWDWRHSSHICVPKQWNGGHFDLPNCRSLISITNKIRSSSQEGDKISVASLKPLWSQSLKKFKAMRVTKRIIIC